MKAEKRKDDGRASAEGCTAGQGLGRAFTTIDQHRLLSPFYDYDYDPTLSGSPLSSRYRALFLPLRQRTLDDGQGWSARGLGSAERRRDGPKITCVAPAGNMHAR